MKQDETESLSIPAASEHYATSKAEEVDMPTTGSKVYVIDKWLLGRMLEAAGNPPLRVVLWDGQEVTTSQSTPVARVFILDRGGLLKLVINPDLYFGELYSAGRIQVEGDLVDVMETIDQALPDFRHRSLWTKLIARLYLLRRNTISRARDNIYHHYDISNDFYRLWLDSQMVYTCAYFPRPTLSLEEAQIAKMDHVCRKLRLRPGEEVVEAGCGWGSLALHMARHYGVKVKAYNISKEQLAYARERAGREGLDDRVEYIEGDYREIKGNFDAFVSVGMLEHVGPHHYRQLGEVIDHCLKEKGRGLIHSIGRNRPAPMNTWIEKYIFPGAYPPSLSEMMNIFEPWNFSILDVENLRLHYAMTLRHWLERYEAAADHVVDMFDPAFVRAWRLYLAGSIATFATGEGQLFQILFTRFNNNEIPWNREYIYTYR